VVLELVWSDAARAGRRITLHSIFFGFGRRNGCAYNGMEQPTIFFPCMNGICHPNSLSMSLVGKRLVVGLWLPPNQYQ
jgi:hypothetical protein